MMSQLVIFAVLLMIVGCGMMPVSKMSKEEDYSTLISQAEKAISTADTVGGEWRDTHKLIKKAKAAAKKGDMKKAITLAKTAKKQGELGFKQANEESSAVPWLF